MRPRYNFRSTLFNLCAVLICRMLTKPRQFLFYQWLYVLDSLYSVLGQASPSRVASLDMSPCPSISGCLAELAVGGRCRSSCHRDAPQGSILGLGIARRLWQFCGCGSERGYGRMYVGRYQRMFRELPRSHEIVNDHL
jgi:hypothetical protein